MKFSKKLLVQIVLFCSLGVFSTNNFLQGMKGNDKKDVPSSATTSSTSTTSSTTSADLFLDATDNTPLKKKLGALLQDNEINDAYILLILKLNQNSKDFHDLNTQYKELKTTTRLSKEHKELCDNFAPLEQKLTFKIHEALKKISEMDQITEAIEELNFDSDSTAGNNLLSAMSPKSSPSSNLPKRKTKSKVAKMFKFVKDSFTTDFDQNVYFFVVEDFNGDLKTFCSFFGNFLNPAILKQQNIFSKTLNNSKMKHFLLGFSFVAAIVITYYFTRYYRLN
jgi:hypothetical protein